LGVADNQHRLTQRALAHDYTRAGVYHITIHVADGLGQPLGKVTGNLSAPDGTADAPHTALTPIGQMVEHELLHTIHAFYPMVTIQDYVIMPEHLHALMVVQDRILSRNGKVLTIGQVIAGFKQGCNRKYWDILKRAKPASALPRPANGATATLTRPAGIAALTYPAANSATATLTHPAGIAALTYPAANSTAAALTHPAGTAALTHPITNSVTGAIRRPGGDERPGLFAPGYCDVIPVDERQLATQRAYISGNPRSRLLRTSNRSRLMPRRGGIDTAVSLPALRGYLQRVCPPRMVAQDALCQLELRLLLAGGKIACDSYGNRDLLTRRCLPVVCHRCDAARLGEQKLRCLQEAERGTVLVSARIAKGEQEITDEALRRGYPVILIADNGFPEVYHPSATRIEQCATGQLLIVSPWQYQYRRKEDTVSVPFCKTMNCVAQALCRTKDTWWQK